MSIFGTRVPPHPQAYKNVNLYDLAKEDGLPSTNATLPDPLLASTSIFGTKIVYKLFAQCRQDKSGLKCMYYIAFNAHHRRNEYAVGPTQLDNFDKHLNWFATGAGNFYGMVPNLTDYQVKSMAFTQAAAAGDFKRAIRKLGSAWLAALQDPGWWLEATNSTVGGVTRLASTSAARITDMRRFPAYARAMETQTNEYGQLVQRTIRIAEEPTQFRHMVTGSIPASDLGRIQLQRSLRFSTGQNAHFGEGVYAWAAGTDGVGLYIDILVPPGTAIETIKLTHKSFFRLVPPTGNKLPVRVIGHNFSVEQMKWAQSNFAAVLKEEFKGIRPPQSEFWEIPFTIPQSVNQSTVGATGLAGSRNKADEKQE